MQVAQGQGFGENAFLVIFCGALSAVGGGLLRDVMVNRTPLILSKEIYATATIPGALIYYYLPSMIGEVPSCVLALVVIFAIRMWAIINKKNLPQVEKILVD